MLAGRVASIVVFSQRNEDNKLARLQSIYTKKVENDRSSAPYCHALRDVVPLEECTIPLAWVHLRRRLCLIDQ